MTDETAAWPGRVSTISVFTDDLAGTKEFYTRVFGLPAMYEDDESAVFVFANIWINVLVATAAPELIEPLPVAPASAGARIQFTIDVPDTDATCATLADLGVVFLNGPMDRPWGVRTATFQDPGGHVWEIASKL